MVVRVITAPGFEVPARPDTVEAATLFLSFNHESWYDPIMLIPDQIEGLASRVGVSRTAVENFLMTLEGSTQAEALANLELDARSYKWNTATNRAIQQGIMMARLGT